MTSGIYELTFSNGDNYIGKSINIENRWKQHFDKFKKGAAAKAMQAAYDRFGPPECKVLLECHTDHIDIMEARCISQFGPKLNSDRPLDPFPETGINHFLHNTDFLSKSTYEHMNDMSKNLEDISALKATVEELEELNDLLLEKRSDEEIASSAGRRVKSLTRTNSSLAKEVSELTAEITKLEEELKYAKLPWWERWFK